MTELTVFKETHCATAPELIEALRTTRPRATLFRGHSDASYELVPSLFREGGWGKLRALIYPDMKSSDKTTTAPKAADIMWEGLVGDFDTLCTRFFEIANRNNLLDLDMSDEVFQILDPRAQRTLFDRSSGNLFAQEGFPPKSLLSFYALMQHQGLPTPLLDWSEKWLVACFFAVDKPDNQLGEGIAVYALSREFMAQTELFIHWPRPTDQVLPDYLSALYRPRLYFPQYRGNANLYAQAGALSYIVNPGDMELRPPPACLFDFRKAIEALWQRFGAPPVQKSTFEGQAELYSPVLQKFTLPREEVPDLRRRLRDFGVTPSTIYPGFDGVRREIEGPWPAD